VLTMNSVKILHAVRSAITATAELLVYLPGVSSNNEYKNFSYRRETARQLRTFFSTRSPIVHFTEHRTYNRLAKLKSAHHLSSALVHIRNFCG